MTYKLKNMNIIIFKICFISNVYKTCVNFIFLQFLSLKKKNYVKRCTQFFGLKGEYVKLKCSPLVFASLMINFVSIII